MKKDAVVSYGTVREYSAAYKLFKMYWICYIPRNEMMDINDFQFFGVAATGDFDTDVKLSTTPEEFSLAPASMAMLLEDGVKIILADPKDAVTIYKLIIQHFEDWNDALDNNELFNLDVPLEGLVEFNKLAAALFPIARSHGLVVLEEKEDPEYKYKRSFSNRTVRRRNARDLQHSDRLMSEIARKANRLGQRVFWKPTQEAEKLAGSVLYG